MEHSRTRKSSDSSSLPWNRDVADATFGDFRVLRQLGEGGMGRVYLAEQISLRRNVAIKVLRPDLTTPTALTRFRAESKIIARLSHANVVQAYTFGEHRGRYYLVLEYVDGVSLRHYLAKKGRLELPLVLSILRRVGSALQAAGELGIIHRDIKPENILLTRKADVKVTDFGLARCLTADEPVDLTRSGTAVGTPRYMSPEQIESKPIDQRTDIYSLGVTCYEMLAGQPPFDGSNAYEIALKHVRDEPVPLETLRPGIAPSVYALIRKMMAKKPTARYASANELLKELAKVRESLGSAVSLQAVPGDDVPVSDSDPVIPMRRKRRPSRAWVLASAGVALLLVAAGITLALVLSSNNSGSIPAPPPDNTPIVEAPKKRDPALDKKERETTLKQLADQHLEGGVPSPGGVDACLDLAVFYLEESKLNEAESLFKRMSERRPPSAYHFVGRLGLAVVDAVKEDAAAAQTKFKELFNPKSKDSRVRILNEYLKKNVAFEEWVNEADTHDIRHTASAGTTAPKTPRFPSGSSLFSKFKIRRP